jgi:queuosine precursor transporter
MPLIAKLVENTASPQIPILWKVLHMTVKQMVALYVSAMVAANLLIAWLGPWFSPINAFVLIGLDLSLRDRLHDAWQGKYLGSKLAALVATAGVISYLLNPASGQIAIASVVAFVAAMTADSVAYQLLKNRPWMQRANGSNVAGAAVDSVIFPTLAFGVLMPHIVLLQFMAKVLGGAVWSLIIKKSFKEEAAANP